MPDYIEVRTNAALTLEQYNEVVSSLVGFIKRVSDGQTASESETAILPETVRVLREFARYSKD